jgi:glycosyltransferase involved in cell wall biosynthesis
MDLTIILCTYNRCQGLAEALTTLAAQHVDPELEWEILLVDNNSSDKTTEVYRRFKDLLSVPLRYVFETRQGLSHARNRGIADASGKYVAFTEDDELADEGWVQAIFDTFQGYSCEAVAGKIDLAWRCPRPQWLTDDLLGFLGYLDYGTAKVLTQDSPPFGGNMAFRKDIFNTIGVFDTQLGRQGRKLIGGEEIELYGRFWQAGLVAVYQPKAVMHHVVEQNRLKKSYFRRLHFNEGQVQGARRHLKPGRRVWGVPLFLIPQLYRSLITFIAMGVRRGFKKSVREEMTVWYFLGFILGCRQTSR